MAEKIQKVEIVKPKPLDVKMSEPKYERQKPSIHGVSEKDLPDIKNWKVGQKYTVEMEVEMTGARKGSDWDMPFINGEKRPDVLTADFKILSINGKEDDATEDLKDKFSER